MARRSGLGRGLDALIPSSPPGPETDAALPGPPGATSTASTASTSPSSGEAPTGDRLQEVPLEAIRPNRFQPRHEFVIEELDELTESIRELGVLQPLLVRLDDSGPEGRDAPHYELVAGERRWRAAKAAGLRSVPVVIREVDDRLALEQALVENLQRSDLNAMEEAVAYQQLMEQFGLTQDAVASRVGRSRPTITNTLRLLQLPGPVQDLVRGGELSAGHARALVTIDRASDQEELARTAIDKGWSVRQLERAVKAAASSATADDADSGRGRTAKSAAVLELEELLADRLATRVTVQMAGDGTRDAKGRIVVEFAGLDDLERVFRAMSGEGDGPGDETA